MKEMQYHFDRLNNGLRMVTIPMRGRSSVSVAIWVRTGSRFEPHKISGASHFLEHMLFKGTKKRTTMQIKTEIEGVGGILNAFTGEESTCYYAKLLKPYAFQALDVLADMVNHAVFDPTELRKERPVILEEIKMYRDQPSQYVHEIMGDLLWRNQPLGRPIAGSLETVSAITRAQMIDYKRRYYHSKNILVTVAGDVSHHDISRAVRKFFAHDFSYPLSKFKPAVSRQRIPNFRFVEKPTEQVNFVIGMHGFSRYHADRYAMGLLNVILGANMSSRLFEEVREQRGLAYEIRSSLSVFEDTGAFLISAGVETEKSKSAILVILCELAKINRRGVKEIEIRRAKDYFMSQLYLAMEDTLDHSLWVGERVLYSNELPDKEAIKRKVESVTARKIQEVARKIFVTKNLNLTLIGPLGSKEHRRIEADFCIKGSS